MGRGNTTPDRCAFAVMVFCDTHHITSTKAIELAHKVGLHKQRVARILRTLGWEPVEQSRRYGAIWSKNGAYRDFHSNTRRSARKLIRQMEEHYARVKQE